MPSAAFFSPEICTGGSPSGEYLATYANFSEATTVTPWLLGFFCLHMRGTPQADKGNTSQVTCVIDSGRRVARQCQHFQVVPAPAVLPFFHGYWPETWCSSDSQAVSDAMRCGRHTVSALLLEDFLCMSARPAQD